MTHVESFLKLLNISPLSAQYTYSVFMFVVNNSNLFLDNANLYSIKKEVIAVTFIPLHVT